MLRLILSRVLAAIPLVVGVSLVIYLLAALAPGSAARTILGPFATPDKIAALEEQLGLNQPWYVGYWDWLMGLVRGDLGTSLFTGAQVSDALNSRLGVTLSLLILSLLVSAALGLTLGMVSALRGGRLSRVLDVVALGGMALPSFWVGLVLVQFFAIRLGWFPATGYVKPTESVSGWLSSLVLPVASLSLLGLTAIAKQTRDSVMEAMEADHVQVLRANGLPELSVIFKHIMRNASIPVVTICGLLSVSLLGGTVFVETVFALPGLGSAATLATLDHDIPMLLGAGVYITVITVLVNFVIDLLYGVLNPKVRVS